MNTKFDEFDVFYGCWKDYIERFDFCPNRRKVKSVDSKKKSKSSGGLWSRLFDDFCIENIKGLFCYVEH